MEDMQGHETPTKGYWNKRGFRKTAPGEGMSPRDEVMKGNAQLTDKYQDQKNISKHNVKEHFRIIAFLRVSFRWSLHTGWHKTKKSNDAPWQKIQCLHEFLHGSPTPLCRRKVEQCPRDESQPRLWKVFVSLCFYVIMFHSKWPVETFLYPKMFCFIMFWNILCHAMNVMPKWKVECRGS